MDNGKLIIKSYMHKVVVQQMMTYSNNCILDH